MSQIYTLNEDVTHSVRGASQRVIVWPAGTRVVFKKTVNVAGQAVAMVHLEDRADTYPFAVLLSKLTLVPPTLGDAMRALRDPPMTYDPRADDKYLDREV